MAQPDLRRIALLIFGVLGAKKITQWSQLFTIIADGHKCRSQNILFAALRSSNHVTPAAALAAVPDVSGMQLVLVPLRFQGTATLLSTFALEGRVFL